MASVSVAKHVLLVDDNEDMLRALVRFLSNDYQLTTASSGEEALQKFGDGQEFDAVITDYHLPEMNGVGLARAIKEIDSEVVTILHSATWGSEDDLPVRIDFIVPKGHPKMLVETLQKNLDR